MRSSICFKGEVQESLSRGVILGAKPLFAKKKKKANVSWLIGKSNERDG